MQLELQTERFPASGLAELERELSRVPFRGESLAAATTGFLNTYRAFRGNHTISKAVTGGGASLLMLVLGPVITIVSRGSRIRLYQKASELTGRVLFVSMSAKTHYQDMLAAVVSEFSSPNVVGMGTQEVERQSVFSPGEYFQKKEIGVVCRFSDSMEVAAITRAWFVVLSRFRVRYRLSWYFVVRSLVCLIRAALRMISYREFLVHLQPVCVVSDFDRYLGNLPVVAAANSLGILTITLQHGTINRTGWETLPSRFFLSWGESSKSRLVKWHGVDSDKVLVCGNLLIADSMQRSRNVRADLRGPDDEKLVVGFAPQPYSMDIRKTWFLRFIEAVDRLPLRVLIKPHPAEDITLYEDHAKAAGTIEILKRSMPISRFFEQCDVIVAIGSSSVAMEAVDAGIPVVLLVVADSASSAASEWAAADAVLLAHTSKELRAALRRLESDTDYYAARAVAGQKYLRKEYAATGKDAARRTHSAIVGLVETSAR